MKSTSTAVWHGAGEKGDGTITTGSRALDQSTYTWKSRFEDGAGTNPEELIAAAHASCISMKLGALLDEAGYKPESIETSSEVTMEKGRITGSRLEIKGKVPGMSRERFREFAERAKKESPVSQVLKLEVTLKASNTPDL